MAGVRRWTQGPEPHPELHQWEAAVEAALAPAVCLDGVAAAVWVAVDQPHERVSGGAGGHRRLGHESQPAP